MKKTILLSLFSFLIVGISAYSQGGLLKKVAKSVTNELLAKPQNNNSDQPEPECACDHPELIMDLGGKLQLDYTEINISISDDGRILAQHHGDYYIVQNGVTTGPIREGDKRLSGFQNADISNPSDGESAWDNNPFISRSGDKYLINFGGKSYGPYAEISKFSISKSKDKFAAIVLENVIITNDQGDRMEEAMNNAKSEQEKMDIAMEFARQMSQKISVEGDPLLSKPEVVTNIQGSTYKIMQGGEFNTKMKYDDIVVDLYDNIIDMQGNTLVTFNADIKRSGQIFISSDNTRYVGYNYGTLTFNDRKTLPDLFSPHLVQDSGQIYLAYMYYSPKKNSILQCKIAF